MKNIKVSFLYMWLGLVFATCIVAANILETKVIAVGPLTLTAGLLCFPVSYIIGDVVSEVYGFKAMLRLIAMGLVMNLLVVVLGNVAAALPSPDYWKGEEGFNFVFSFAPRITFASFVAFAIGSAVNAKIMEYMHHRHGERHFCIRAIWSTILGEGADSLVFFPIAFGGVLPFAELVKLIIMQITLKTLYEVIILPLTVRVVRLVNSAERHTTVVTDSAPAPMAEVKGETTEDTGNIALVLADGGAKGYAHIGAIQALEESGRRITSIAGTSMGALVGGLYAAGKLKEGFEFLKTVDKRKVFSLSDFRHISLNGIIGGENIYDRIRDIIGDVRIEDLDVKYCAIATNIDTGEEKVFTKGLLIDAIRASISVPAIFTPYSIGGERYVDGAMTNGLPINRVIRTSGDKVVAINLDTYASSQNNSFTHLLKYGYDSSDSAENSGRTRLLKYVSKAFGKVTGENMLNVLINSFCISMKQNKILMAEMSRPDMYINIDMSGFDMHNFDNAEEISRLGYEQVRRYLQEHDRK